jgi:nitrate/TMAO reductase-like tetraheme cytochrome c subunit
MDNAIKRMILNGSLWAIALVMVLIAHEAMAGNVSAAQNRHWKAECGSCHTAYPPQLLPASAWRGIMSGLDKHFGTDASLDADSVAEIGAFLEQHAGTTRRARGARTLRVTESAWFQRKHGEISPTVWTLPAVKSPANCAACHTTADQGDFRERNIRIPN